MPIDTQYRLVARNDAIGSPWRPRGPSDGPFEFFFGGGRGGFPSWRGHRHRRRRSVRMRRGRSRSRTSGRFGAGSAISDGVAEVWSRRPAGGLASHSPWARPRRTSSSSRCRRLPVPVAQIKPRTILFTDKPATIWSIRRSASSAIEDWAKARPVAAAVPRPLPGYTEPNVDIIVDGTQPPLPREAADVCDGGALRAVAAAGLAQARGACHAAVRRADRSRHQAPGRDRRGQGAPEGRKGPATSIRTANGARAAEVVICLRSAYKLEGRLPVGIALANKLREGSRRISDTIEFESEIAVLSAAEVDESGWQAHRGGHAAGRGAGAEHVLHQPGDAVRQASGDVPAHPERPRQDRGQRDDGAGGRIQHARQAEEVSPTCR